MPKRSIAPRLDSARRDCQDCRGAGPAAPSSKPPQRSAMCRDRERPAMPHEPRSRRCSSGSRRGSQISTPLHSVTSASTRLRYRAGVKASLRHADGYWLDTFGKRATRARFATEPVAVLRSQGRPDARLSISINIRPSIGPIRQDLQLMIDLTGAPVRTTSELPFRNWTRTLRRNGAPKGNRTPVFAVKGRRPRPLDDGRGRRGAKPWPCEPYKQSRWLLARPGSGSSRSSGPSTLMMRRDALEWTADQRRGVAEGPISPTRSFP